MVYKINWLEKRTTSTGKNKIDATLINSLGELFEKVTIWEDFPNFATLAPEREVEGEIIVKQNGQYTNKTLTAPKPKVSIGSYPQRSPSAITKAMDKKEASIERFQDTKQEAIEKAAAFRDATLLTAAFAAKITDLSVEDMQGIWEHWHQWLTAKQQAPF